MITPASSFALILAQQLKDNFDTHQRKEIFRELTVAGFCLECGEFTETGACSCFVVPIELRECYDKNE